MSNRKISNSKQRIKELMDYYGMKSSDLCKRTGLGKSALSNYLNGDREPRQDQISLIVDPFNICPAWLMGYDVPMFNTSSCSEHPDEDELIAMYRSLNGAGKKEALKMVRMCTNQEEYKLKGEDLQQSSKIG